MALSRYVIVRTVEKIMSRSLYSTTIATTYAISAYRSGEVYSIQHYVRKFVSDLRQVGGFLRVLRFPPTIKLTATI